MTDRSMAATLRKLRTDVNLLQRRLVRRGGVDLESRIEAGGGISVEGAGSVASPFVISATNMQTGTAAQRAVTPSEYWHFWQDTDGSERLYVGDRSGGWRQFSGHATATAGAWSTTVTVSGQNIFAGRTVNLDLPTLILGNETLILSQVAGGSGFGFASLNTMERNVTPAGVTVRQMQMASLVTQSLTVAWQLARI